MSIVKLNTKAGGLRITMGSAKQRERYIFAGRYIFRGDIVRDIMEQSGSYKQTQSFISYIYSRDNMCHFYRSIVDNSNEDDHDIAHTMEALYGIAAVDNPTLYEGLSVLLMDAYLDKDLSVINPGLHDLWTKLKLLSETHYGVQPILYSTYTSTSTKDDTYTSSVIIGDDMRYEATHKSYKISRERVLRQAYRDMIDIRNEELLNDPEYQKLIQLKKASQDRAKIHAKSIKAIKHQEYIAQREKARLERKAVRVRNDLIKKEYRRKSKIRSTAAKRRRREDEEKFLKMLQNISGKKRRLLEDKGIIEKRK